MKVSDVCSRRLRVNEVKPGEKKDPRRQDKAKQELNPLCGILLGQAEPERTRTALGVGFTAADQHRGQIYCADPTRPGQHPSVQRRGIRPMLVVCGKNKSQRISSAGQRLACNGDSGMKNGISHRQASEKPSKAAFKIRLSGNPLLKRANAEKHSRTSEVAVLLV